MGPFHILLDEMGLDKEGIHQIPYVARLSLGRRVWPARRVRVWPTRLRLLIGGKGESGTLPYRTCSDTTGTGVGNKCLHSNSIYNVPYVTIHGFHGTCFTGIQIRV